MRRPWARTAWGRARSAEERIVKRRDMQTVL
jgi:hypothetical protein